MGMTLRFRDCTEKFLFVAGTFMDMILIQAAVQLFLCTVTAGTVAMHFSFCLSTAEILFIAAITVGVAFLGAADRTDCFTAVCMMVTTFRQTAGQSGLPAAIGMFFVCLSADQIRQIARRIVGVVIFGQTTGNICLKTSILVNMVLRNAA